jgi:hypothetical protein
MEIETVRDRAQAFCDALVSGDVGLATEVMSSELRQNLGEVIAMLPLPASEASVVSVDRGGSGFDVVIRLVGETEDVEIQTRWKDRDGQPTLVEASHLSKTARDAAETSEETEAPADAVEG